MFSHCCSSNIDVFGSTPDLITGIFIIISSIHTIILICLILENMFGPSSRNQRRNQRHNRHVTMVVPPPSRSAHLLQDRHHRHGTASLPCRLARSPRFVDALVRAHQLHHRCRTASRALTTLATPASRFHHSAQSTARPGGSAGPAVWWQLPWPNRLHRAPFSFFKRCFHLAASKNICENV